LNRNAKSRRILTKLRELDSESLQESEKFVTKYSSAVELLIVKHRRQNISVSIALISAVTQLKPRLIEEWEHFNQMMNRSSTKQPRSGVHVYKLAFELRKMF